MNKTLLGNSVLGDATIQWGIGLLGATTENPEMLSEVRLLEIERRILAIEAVLAPSGPHE